MIGAVFRDPEYCRLGGICTGGGLKDEDEDEDEEEECVDPYPLLPAGCPVSLYYSLEMFRKWLGKIKKLFVPIDML